MVFTLQALLFLGAGDVNNSWSGFLVKLLSLCAFVANYFTFKCFQAAFINILGLQRISCIKVILTFPSRMWLILSNQVMGKPIKRFRMSIKTQWRGSLAWLVTNCFSNLSVYLFICLFISWLTLVNHKNVVECNSNHSMALCS